MKKQKIIISLLIGIPIVFYAYIAYVLPLSLPSLPVSTIIYDLHNREIGEVIRDKSIRHRRILYADIPTFYIKSLIWMEDRSFFDNSGLSWRGIARSVVRNIQSGLIVEGASTLSAQYVRNVLWINEPRDLAHKVLESLYAIRLNHIMNKEEILTGYINQVSFGYLNYGLKSAAIYYFGKEPHHLTLAEQTALLVLPKNPNKYDPYKYPEAFRQRFELIVSSLESGGIITQDESRTIRREKLDFRRDHRQVLPYVVDFLASKNLMQSGGALETSFDIGLTERIDAIARSVLDELSWRNVSDYGILIAEKTEQGPVLRVMIGGKDYHESEEGQVNTTLSQRQPGSTLKPFTYLLAFQKLGLTPESTITDLPIQFKTVEGYSYEPKNYSQDYKGEVTLREALSQSINIPAIKLLEKIGIQILLDFLRHIGISTLSESSDHYGLALTLGDGEVTLYELLQAYSIFAYDGQFCPMVLFRGSESPCMQKIEKKYTDMILSILSDRYAKLPGFPVNSSLDFPDRWVAVKTGTSRNFRDNWTIGITEHYMIGVWTGNKNGENMKGVSGATGAGEIFARIVYALEQEEYIPSPLQREKLSEEYLEITSPIPGSLYKKELSRKSELQKVALEFRTNISYDTFYWRVDGQILTGSTWPITPGTHTAEIVLLRNGNKEYDRKSVFEVIK